MEILSALGTCGKNLSRVSVSCSFPSSTSCRIITAVYVFVIEAIRNLLAAVNGLALDAIASPELYPPEYLTHALHTQIQLSLDGADAH